LIAFGLSDTKFLVFEEVDGNEILLGPSGA